MEKELLFLIYDKDKRHIITIDKLFDKLFELKGVHGLAGHQSDAWYGLSVTCRPFMRRKVRKVIQDTKLTFLEIKE